MVYEEIHYPTSSSGGLASCVVTIGNFDGCHLGHQTLLKRANELSQQLGVEAVALTFDPRPQVYFGRASEQNSLFTQAQKAEAAKNFGVPVTLVQRFDRRFQEIDYGRFYHDFLRKYLNVRGIVVGENFRFGYKRLGDVEHLRAFVAEDSEKVELAILPSLHKGGSVVSSSRVRQLLLAGEVSMVQELLGRPYALQGVVERGEQIGRHLGYPTLNLGSIAQLIPAEGVYAGFAVVGDASTSPSAVRSIPSEAVPSVFSISKRPTFQPQEKTSPLRVEGHVLSDFSGNSAYGLGASFYFTHFIRGIKTFGNKDELQLAIENDVAKAKRVLQAASKGE